MVEKPSHCKGGYTRVTDTTEQLDQADSRSVTDDITASVSLAHAPWILARSI